MHGKGLTTSRPRNSGQFDNGTLYPSSWYATSKGRDLNVTMTQVAADGKPACREAGVFATKTKPPATKGAIPTPKIEGEDPSSSASSTKITSGAAAPQLAVAVAVALFSALAGVLVLL